MGMYTSLRFEGQIKEEMIERFEKAFSQKGIKLWKGLAELCPESPTLQKWSEYSRCNFIPFGALCSVPWWESSWPRKLSDEGRLQFQCSLKDYDCTIDYFRYNVVPLLFEEVSHFEEWYEEDASSTLSHYKDGVWLHGLPK